MSARPGQPRLHVVPLTYRQACQLVEELHRHHRPPRGHKLSVGVADEGGRVVGVAMLGRPVARALDDGLTLEVTRTATDGTPNANSALYGAARRLALAAGYSRLITYTMTGETGASLRGAGWRPVAQRGPRPGWSTPAREREDQGLDGVARTRWEAVLRPQRLAPHTVHGARTGACTHPSTVTSHTEHARHVTPHDITPGGSSHGSTHAMHAGGALTVAPPSIEGAT